MKDTFISQGCVVKKNKYYKPDRKLRIFWNSNACFCHSGYGTQTNLIVYGLLKAGFPIAHCAFYGLQGFPVVLDGLKIYPVMADTWGSDSMLCHSKDWNADINISYQDVWPMDDNIMRQVKKWIPLTMIDSEPIHPGIIQRLRLAWKILVPAQFAKDMLSKSGFNSEIIYHGVDTDVYKPMDKKDCLKTFGIPEGRFIFGSVAANKDNPPRKSFQEMFDAFKAFHDRHSEAAMFMQTQLTNPGGFPIKEYIHNLGLDNDVFFVDDYASNYKLDSEAMAKMFNCFDCLLIPSQSEGFGLPLIEAQACGVPVITQNWTTMPETIIEGETGFAVKTAYKRWTSGLNYFAVPDTQDILDKMEMIYKADRIKMGDNARKYMLKKYDFNNVLLPRWIEFLEGVEKDLYPEIDTK
jgi:glycosyltransferase involved in cell wall biosynthesis